MIGRLLRRLRVWWRMQYECDDLRAACCPEHERRLKR